LGHAFERNQALVDEAREHIGEQRVERITMADPKLRQLRVPHRLVADDPAEGFVAADPARDLARAADPHAHRVEPQGEQHPHAHDGTALAPLDRLGIAQESRHIQRLDHAPEQPGPVIRRQRVVGQLEANDSLGTKRLARADTRAPDRIGSVHHRPTPCP